MTARALVVVAALAVACGGEDGEPPGPRGIGEIRVATVLDAIGPGADLTSIDAYFERAGTRRSCAVSEHGACVVYACAGDAGKERPDAGELSLTTADGRFSQSLLPNASGFYSFGDESDFLVPGDEITVSFEGGDVPAFDVTGSFPEPVVLTEPEPPAVGEPLVVSASADAVLRWSGGVAGNVVSVSVDAPSSVLRCTVGAEKGVLTVPASALAELEGGRLDLRTVKTVVAEPSGYDVTLVLLAAVVDDGGDGVSLVLEP